MTEQRTTMPGRIRSLVLVPVLAMVLAFVVGALFLILSSPLIEGSVDLLLPVRAYGSLVSGALGSPQALVKTLVNSTPLILAGLAVGIGFKAGLFNIGAQGQYLMGALAATAVALALNDASPAVAIPASVLAGMAGGLVYGMIPGLLKAFTGAHEVVVTIMLNYIAINIVSYVVNGPLLGQDVSYQRTDDIVAARLPIIIGDAGHLGILFAVVSVPIVWWFLFRSTIGFEVRTTGANSEAARYAGMNPRWLIVFTMSLCGLFAGLAGASVILGQTGYLPASYNPTIGFEAISVALLGRAHPVGILLSGLLFGAMRTGGIAMQSQLGIPFQFVLVLQAIILFFLTAEVLVRRIFRVREASRALGDVATLSDTYASRP
jgi:simple sugar transport system permease protein